MIRSSSHSLRFANQKKKEDLNTFFVEYRRFLQELIVDIWDNGIQGFDLDIKNNKLNCPSLLPNDYLKNHTSWMTARMKQCAGKQACSMIKTALKKRFKQLYMLKKLQQENKSTKYLQRKIDIRPLRMPNAVRAKIELDSRFLDFQTGDHFDTFVRVKTIGNGIVLKIPIQHTCVSRRWLKSGKQKNAIRLTEDKLILLFDIKDVPKKDTGIVVGADQGQTTVLSLSDKQVTTSNKDGYNLSKIQDVLSRRKKGSKGFKRAQEHRKNHIHWSLNQLNFSSTREVRLEKIKHIRFGLRNSRKSTHWTYPLIKDKLVSLSEVKGFRLVEVPNEFRSQRCSSCGWVRKANRKGKTFKCSLCGYLSDADLNAASNLLLDLFEIPFWVRYQKLNRFGFFWLFDGLYSESHEPIVRDTLKAVMEDISI